MMVMMVAVIAAARTGRRWHHSTAWLTVMATARLSQDHPPPQIACQFANLF
jgi:hypothetical protein